MTGPNLVLGCQWDHRIDLTLSVWVGNLFNINLLEKVFVSALSKQQLDGTNVLNASFTYIIYERFGNFVGNVQGAYILIYSYINCIVSASVA